MKHILTLAALVFATSCFGQEACPAPIDVNSNGAVDIADFLNVLGLFGDVDSDGDGVWDSQDGCIDVEACNYSSPLAGICTYQDALGDCNGNCPADADGDGVCDVYLCGDLVSYHGYEYATVLIGDQCWFAENLRSESYENGDAISLNSSESDSSLAPVGVVAVFGEGVGCENSADFNACDPTLSLQEYGRLYNWHAVEDARGLCPSGWHVPTDNEWTLMIDELGGWTTAGTKLKTDYGYFGIDTGTNSSGFSGLPGGSMVDGYSQDSGRRGNWWSSSSEGAPEFQAWQRNVRDYDQAVFRSDTPSKTLLSIRCIQDSE